MRLYLSYDGIFDLERHPLEDEDIGGGETGSFGGNDFALLWRYSLSWLYRQFLQDELRPGELNPLFFGFDDAVASLVIFFFY